MSWEQSVFSEMVSAVGYEENEQALIITWKKSGRKSAYLGVPEEVAVQVANAPSVGQMLNSEIKPNYAHKYV